MDTSQIAATLREQHGVIANFQLHHAGAAKHDIDRLLRRRDLVRLYPGVYLNHTGRPSRTELHSAAVLRYWPAALSSFSAVDLHAWSRDPHIMIDSRRSVTPTPGIVIRRCNRFRSMVREQPFPPRQRVEEATLDAAKSLKRIDESFTFLADVVQSRRTTADRLLRTLSGRQRFPRRKLIEELLTDIGTGAASVLEREWMRLEGLHRLPAGDRQSPFRARSKSGFRDVLYANYGLVVELDGRAFHNTAAARNADAKRDLLAASERFRTVRLTYGQVFGEPCQTIAGVATVLGQGGWTGRIKRCPRC